MTAEHKAPQLLYDIGELCHEYLTDNPTALQWSNAIGALTANLCAYLETIEGLNDSLVHGIAVQIKQQISDCVDRITQGVH